MGLADIKEVIKCGWYPGLQKNVGVSIMYPGLFAFITLTFFLSTASSRVETLLHIGFCIVYPFMMLFLSSKIIVNSFKLQSKSKAFWVSLNLLAAALYLNYQCSVQLFLTKETPIEFSARTWDQRVVFPIVNDRPNPNRAAVILGPDGTMKSPLSHATYDFLGNLEGNIMLDPPLKFKDEISVIIAARNEDDYIEKTLYYLFKNTNPSALKEIILVDDFSTRPLKDLLSNLPSDQLQKIRFLRNDVPEGLIRSRLFGAEAAISDVLFFLDAHSQVRSGWLSPLLAHLHASYRRIICPRIHDIDGISWQDKGTSGLKMRFDWHFEFSWYEDNDEDVPLAAGGIYAITKQWWNQIDQYDDQLYEWGAENIEQSIKAWLCGGDIRISKASNIGHVFDRPPILMIEILPAYIATLPLRPAKPNEGNKLVERIQLNQKRVAKTWLDNYYAYFIRIHKEASELPDVDVTERLELRKNLGCARFKWYVDRFHTNFERSALLFHERLHIKHVASGLCLTASPTIRFQPTSRSQKHLATSLDIDLVECDDAVENQFFSPVLGNRMIFHYSSGLCITKGKSASSPITLKTCNWKDTMSLKNSGQFWYFNRKNGSILNFSDDEAMTLSGNDIYAAKKHLTEKNTKTTCLTARLNMESLNAKPHLVGTNCLVNTLEDQLSDLYRFELIWKEPDIDTRFPLEAGKYV